MYVNSGADLWVKSMKVPPPCYLRIQQIINPKFKRFSNRFRNYYLNDHFKCKYQQNSVCVGIVLAFSKNEYEILHTF